MENHIPATPDRSEVAAILGALEQHLAALDRIGARIAAAHLDAAIQRLRTDQARRCLGDGTESISRRKRGT